MAHLTVRCSDEIYATFNMNSKWVSNNVENVWTTHSTVKCSDEVYATFNMNSKWVSKVKHVWTAHFSRLESAKPSCY